MASFHVSKTFTADLEGGFWNDPSAGWTYKGITKKYYPTWPGFKRLEQLRLKHFGSKEIPRYTRFNDTLLDSLVADFYKNNFWNKIYGDYIANQTIANFMYDFFVHKQNDAMKVINTAAQATDASVIIKTTSLTASVVNAINAAPAAYYTKLYTLRLAYYAGSSKFSKSLKEAFKKRVLKFPETI